MKREEERREAARKYATHDVDTDETDFYGNYIKKEDFVLPEYNAFLEGCKWSDENPKSSWISVKDDLPCNHKELISETPKLIHSKNVLTTKNVLVILTYNIGKLVSMVYINNKWEWDCVFKDEIIFWIPIPELPKELDIKL